MTDFSAIERAIRTYEAVQIIEHQTRWARIAAALWSLKFEDVEQTRQRVLADQEFLALKDEVEK